MNRIPFSQRILVVFSLACCLAFLVPTHILATDFDDNWRKGFHLRGIIGRVESIINHDGQLVVGGFITRAGLAEVNNIVTFDLESLTFSPLGEGIDKGVVAMTNYLGNLVVLQNPITYPEPKPQNVFSWDGEQWSNLGETLPEGTKTAAGLGNDLYAGRFRWDGVQWHEELSIDGVINCQIEWNGLLICGGSFTEVNGVSAQNIVAWDGIMTLPLGDGFNDEVRALCLRDGALIAGGDFTQSGESSINMVGSWDGTAWSDQRLPIPISAREYVTALGVFQGNLAVSLIRQSLFSPGTYVKIQNDGGDWDNLLESGDQNVRALCKAGDELLIGGQFQGMNDVASANLVRYDGTNLLGTHATGIGLPDMANALCMFDEKLFVSGDFLYAGSSSSPVVAAFDSQQWQPAGSYFSNGYSYPFNSWFSFLALVTDGVELVGYYSHFSGCLDSYYLGTWVADCSCWYGEVDLEERVPATFIFEYLVSHSYNRVFIRFDDIWTELPGEFDGQIEVVESWNNAVVVGGNFSGINGISANNIVGWAGEWFPLGDGLPGRVTSIGQFNGDLVASYSVDGYDHVSRLNGPEWEDLGDRFSGRVVKLVQYGDHLYSAGRFSSVGDRPAVNIAWWNGQHWFPYGRGIGGSGIYSEVYDMEVFGNELYLVGDFHFAGNQVSDNIACIKSPLPTTSAVEGPPTQPQDGVLHPNVPNPFNPETEFHFSLPQPGHISLAVFDVKGRLVRTIADGKFTAGDHILSWDGTNNVGQDMPSGVYLSRLNGVCGEHSRKITLAR